MGKIETEGPEGETGPSLADLIPAPELRADKNAWASSPYTRYELLLLYNIKMALPRLKELRAKMSLDTLSGRACDGVYRFYHCSYKVFYLQASTLEIVRALEQLTPRISADDDHSPLNEMFLQIVKEGTGLVFSHEHNKHWPQSTRPILEAFFHAKYFLDMLVIAGETLELPQCLLDEGWACILELYNMR